jgi:plasmid stabilization system protein ParE
MPQFAVEFHPLAADEAEAAERWYRDRNEITSDRFQREISRAIDLISQRPDAGSPYLSKHEAHIAAPLSVLRGISRPQRQRSDRRGRACAAAARILAHAGTARGIEAGGLDATANDAISRSLTGGDGVRYGRRRPARA